MVEVVKQGVAPGEREHEVECRNCGSVLRFKEREAVCVPDQRDGDYFRIECPVCDGLVTCAKTRLRAPERIAVSIKTPSICSQCGLPHGQCDPEGVGHYRG